MERDIIDFPNYRISSEGKVRSVITGKVLKTFLCTSRSNHHPREKISLYKNGKSFKKLIHRLVAEAFIPNPEKKPQVNHKDGNPLNNNLSNLEWVTQKENVEHAVKNKLFCHGERHPKSPLTQKMVDEIREKHIPLKCSYPMLAREYGVNQWAIARIVRRENWK